MNWLYSFDTLILIFVALFVVFYFLYILRVVRISRKLHVPYSAVFIKLLLRSAMFALLIVALLGPSFGEGKREVKSEGKDIFILIDLSQSMNANDVQPTRLEKVKFELKNIINSFSSDRIGLIIFSSEAFVQVPLTFDQNILNLFTETLNTSLVPNTGTDFTSALKLALNKLNAEDSPVTQQKSKAIILISDGEDFGDESRNIAKEIEKAGIKLFTLGVGTSRGSKLVTNGILKKDNNGNDVITKLESTTLRNLAKDTDGKYFEINETKNDVSRLINTLNSIEGEIRDTRQIDVSVNRFYYFLGAALLLLIIDILTSVKTVRI